MAPNSLSSEKFNIWSFLGAPVILLIPLVYWLYSISLMVPSIDGTQSISGMVTNNYTSTFSTNRLKTETRLLDVQGKTGLNTLILAGPAERRANSIDVGDEVEIISFKSWGGVYAAGIRKNGSWLLTYSAFEQGYNSRGFFDHYIIPVISLIGILLLIICWVSDIRLLVLQQRRKTDRV